MPPSAGIRVALVAGMLAMLSAAPAFAQPAPPSQATGAPRPSSTNREENRMTSRDHITPTTIQAEMKAAAGLTTKVLAIGSWTAKAPPESRPAIMPSEARDTLRLQLQGKIDAWYAKSDGSGAVFLMNVTTPAEAHRLLEALPLGQADMMTFDLIPVGPLWPLGLLLAEPAH